MEEQEILGHSRPPVSLSQRANAHSTK